MAVIEFQTHTKNELAGVDWAKNIDEYRFSPTPLLYMIFFLLIVRVRLKRFSQVWCQFNEKRIYLHKRIGKDNLKASTDNFDSEISKGTTLFLQLPSPPPFTPLPWDHDSKTTWQPNAHTWHHCLLFLW